MGDARPGRCCRSCAQETRGRLVSARIKLGTARSPTCSRGHSHCGSRQKGPLLLYPLPHAAAAPLQAGEQHPTAAAPIFPKFPAVGHEMELAAVWRVAGRVSQPWLSLPTPPRGATREAMLLPPRVTFTARVCVQRPAGATHPQRCPAPPPVLGAAQHHIDFMLPPQPSVLAGPPRAPSAGAGWPGMDVAGTRQGPSAGRRQGLSWQQPPAACLGNACLQVRAPSSVLLASPAAVPLRGSVLLILAFLPRAQQHNLLPALQGNASEAPGAQAGNHSLQSDGAGAGFQPREVLNHPKSLRAATCISRPGFTGPKLKPNSSFLQKLADLPVRGPKNAGRGLGRAAAQSIPSSRPAPGPGATHGSASSTPRESKSVAQPQINPLPPDITQAVISAVFGGRLNIYLENKDVHNCIWQD